MVKKFTRKSNRKEARIEKEKIRANKLLELHEKEGGLIKEISLND